MTTHSETGSFDLSALNNLNQNLTQYFWFEEGGSGSYPWGLGAHITLYPQSDFTNPNDSNYLKGQNILINTDGFSLRNGTIPLMVLDNDSLDFNLITNLSQGTYVNVATFGASGATIGQLGGAHSVIDTDGQRFYASNGTTLLANIGYGEGTDEDEGQSVEPFYTMGVRAGNTVGNWSMAEGYLTTATGYCSHAEGIGTNATGANSHAEGEMTTASEEEAHAEGWRTTASEWAAHAEGYHTTASGVAAHAEGTFTSATSTDSHAEGYYSEGNGAHSHAEGYMTKANGLASHAEGYYATASHEASHAGGKYTTTSRDSQTVIGEYNKDDTSALFIIGNGTSGESSDRKNAFTVDTNGNVNISSGAKYKINGTALSASDVGAVPTSRTVNSKALSSNITLTASDVGALATSGGNITGNLSYKSSTIDASLANNGVSSTQYPTTFNILDKSNRILTRKEAVIESNGNISAYWYVRNYNTSGSQVGQKGIKITMNKSGAVTYGVDEPSKFLSALSMNKYTRSSSGALDWSNQTDGDSHAIMKSALAFWNGCYSGTSSNLSRCTQGQIIGRNQICYANSRVDTFSSGSITLSLATLGITTGAKPVGILLTPEYSSGVTMKYDYDGSSASGVKIYAYTANGSAYSGALRYFAVVFQNTWTST